MGRDQARMLICAVASLVLIVAGALVMDWYHLTVETVGRAGRAAIDLRSVHDCSAGPPCVTQSVMRVSGMFPTLAVVTLWSSLGFAGLVALQAGARLLTGSAHEAFTKLGYMLALMAISLTVATAYMFGPEARGVAAALASHTTSFDLHRTWAPLTLVVGLSLGFIAVYLAVARESSDPAAAYKPVSLPPPSPEELRARQSSVNRTPAPGRPRAATRGDPTVPARNPRAISSVGPGSAIPKASTSGAMTTVERPDPLEVQRTREINSVRPRDAAGGPGTARDRGRVSGATRATRDPGGERRDAAGAARTAREVSSAEHRDHTSRPPTGRDPRAAERHGNTGPQGALRETGAGERRDRSDVHRPETSTGERRDRSGLSRPDAAERREASGAHGARETSAVERRDRSGMHRSDAAGEPRERTGTPRPTRDLGPAERREPSGAHGARETSAVERRERSGVHRSDASAGPGEPRERTGTLRPTRDMSAVEPREQSGTFGAREPSTGERRERSGVHRPDASAGEPRERTGTLRAAREISSAEHRDYTGRTSSELASGEPRPGAPRGERGVAEPREHSGTLRTASDGRSAEPRMGTPIAVLRPVARELPRAGSEVGMSETPEHTGALRAPGDASAREQSGLSRAARGTTSAVGREPMPPIGSTPIGVLRASDSREQTGVLRAPRGGEPGAPSETTGPGAGRTRAPAPPAPPEHLRNRLAYVALTAELTTGGIDARREDGLARLVLWRDVVGVVARRMPPDAGGAAFIDIVSTAGSTLRIVPWTRLSGEPLAAEGDDRPRAMVEHIVARCPGVQLDPATQHFLDTGEPAQLPDLETLRAHDSRLA